MAAIWHLAEGGWTLLAPVGFADEETLHTLVEGSPQILPLAGAPNLVVLGREVQLGGNSADLIAIEPAGRLCIIEIKLARNSEARRAIVAQVLAYAAALQGISVDDLDGPILGMHLARRGYDSVAQAVARNDQLGQYEPDEFASTLGECLASGRFRLVLVLDSAPPELVRLCGYLQTISDRLLIDLITVSAYEAGGQRILVPQRVDWERTGTASTRPGTEQAASRPTRGAEEFERLIEFAPADRQQGLRELVDWARGLEAEGLARLESFRGKNNTTLLPRLSADGVGLITIGMPGRPLWFYRSVWERKAPELIAQVETLTGMPMGQGTSSDATAELLAVIRDAYRIAVHR